MSGTRTSRRWYTPAGDPYPAGSGASGWPPSCTRSLGGVAACSCPSRGATTLPCDTPSPPAMRTSPIVPATGDGTSMVALSDSSVTSGSSTATTSPGETCTSITGTSAKSPISGTRISMGSSRLEQQAADVLEHVAQGAGEPGGQGAVDHPVVVGQRHRQHQPGHELRAVPNRRHPGRDHPT